jgi:hypothetical protein
VVVVALTACSSSNDSTTTTTKPLDPFATSGASSASSSAAPLALAPSALAVGQCFDTDQFIPGAAIDLTTARVVDCSEPHQHEVYAVKLQTAAPGTPYPGDAALAAFADDQCLADFTAYTGVDYRASSYDIANARPDAASWDRGERHVICALHDADFGQLVGSTRAQPAS